MAPPAERIAWSTEVFIDARHGDRQLRRVRLPDEVHISLARNGEAPGISLCWLAVLCEEFRAGTGHEPFHVDEIFHRKPQLVAVHRTRPVGNKGVVSSRAVFGSPRGCAAVESQCCADREKIPDDEAATGVTAH